MDIKDLLANKIFTVSEFNTFANSILAPLQVTVEGEISDYKVSQNKFVWFTLKDQEQALSCFSMVFRIKQPLEDGMKVKVTGYPKIFGKSGRLSFNVEGIELSGQGSLQRAYLLLKAQLEREGLFNVARKRSLPRFPKIIGLITSREAAAYTDFLKQINARIGGITIRLSPVAVQGAKAVDEIVAALNYFNRANDRPDLLVLTRGGGSLEDLQSFNTEDVARAVFSSKIPIVCAIGHERDITLAELSADVRASTPTHAAQLAVPDRIELGNIAAGHTLAQRHAVERVIHRLRHRLHITVGNFWETLQSRIVKIKSLFLQFSFAGQALDSRRQLWQVRLQNQANLLKSLSPTATLARGYSIVRKSGKIIKASDNVFIGDSLEITLSAGSVESEVKKINIPNHKQANLNQ